MARILCPTVVGRQDEIAQLGRALDAAQRGRGGMLVVSGPAGVGKSRLLAEAGAVAERHAATVLAGRCVPSAVAIPYRPLGEALIAAPKSVIQPGSEQLTGFEAALGWIVPAWRGAGSVLSPESPVVVAEALLRALRSVAGATGCVLLVEDIQWADPETLHAIEYLADHSTSARVLVVCSVRADATPDVWATVTRLESRRAVGVIRLGPLSPEHVVEMASRSLDTAALDGKIVQLLEESAEGLPFLVEELLATAATSGALLRDKGEWHLSPAVQQIVPESFAVSVRERLHAMGPDGRRLLGAAALLGRSFDWQVAARSAGCARGMAEAILERGLGFQLLAVRGDAFSFRHALTREALLSELLPHERTELAARCLETVEEASASAPDERYHLAADLAEAAGQPDRAASLLLQAARRSLNRGARETAGTLLERALSLATDTGLQADLQEALAEAASTAGDLPRTRAMVESLVRTLALLGAPAARRAQAHLLLARCAVTVTHFDVAREELSRARALAEELDDAALVARVTAVAAQLAIGEGRAVEAEELATQAAAEAEATDQPEVVCEALEVAARCARTRDLDLAKMIGDQSLHVAEKAGLAYWHMRALYQIGVVEMFRSYSIQTLVRARDEAQRLGAVAASTSLDLEVTAALEAQFRLEEARETCLRCLEMAELLDLRGVQAVAHAFIAIIEAGHGSRRRMEDAISKARAIAGDDVELNGALWGDARAINSLAAEDRVRARQDLEQARAIYGQAPPSVLPRLGTALFTVLDAVDGREPDLDATAGITRLNAQGAGYLAYAEAVLLGRAGRPAAALQAAQRGDQHLALCPWYRNLMRRLIGEAALRDGWGEPVAWLDEAAGFFDAAGNDRLASACRTLLRRAGVRVSRPTRALKALPAALREAGVTPREAEVLALVGEGLSNREIAGRLFLSERTVEQHVGWVKQKLGLRTRAQLAVYAAAETAGAR